MNNNKIGVDITYNKRFVAFINDEKKYSKILSSKEIEVFNKISNDKRKLEYIASRFAAKEAIFKAINNKASFREISILNNEDGSPYVEQSFTNCVIRISLSHETDYSIAFVIID